MRFIFSINKREALGAGLLCLFGLAAVLQVSANSVGRISGLGAGTLPVFLGSLLMFVGVLWLFESRLAPDDDEGADIGPSKWRGCCGIVSGTFAFLLLAKYGGVILATFAFVYVSALGDPQHTWRSALLLSVCVTALGTLCLALAPLWGLSLPLPMFRWG